MASLQSTLDLSGHHPESSSILTLIPAPEINNYCRGTDVWNHSCRQCLKRTLEAYGMDADAWDAKARAQGNRQRSRALRATGRDRGRPDISHKQRQLNYGITPEYYRALLLAQNGVCALCGEPETQTLKGTLISLSVDHDHKTGKVRGLLCIRCNRGLHYIETLGLRWARRAHGYLQHDTAGSVPQPVKEEIVAENFLRLLDHTHTPPMTRQGNSTSSTQEGVLPTANLSAERYFPLFP
jgi:hypothetical protein